MHAIVRFTLRQQVLFNLLFVVLMLVGIFAFNALPTERYPEINFGKAIITTVYPGAAPSDVEALVTRKIERAIEGLEDLEFVRASSVQERSTITVKFRDDSDYDRLFDALRFRVLGVVKDLPDLVDPPRFDLVTTSFWLPVLVVNLTGERGNRALTLLAEELKVPLAAIPGVDRAPVVGEQTQEFHVRLDPARLNRFGVTFEAVATALTDANLLLPAGTWQDASGEFVVRVDERFRSREQVVRTIVRSDADGSVVRVADLIASADMAYRKAHVINSVNGQDVVSVQVFKGEGGNALEIKAAVEAIVAEFSPVLEREGVRAVLTQDSTTYIRESVATLGWNMIVGIALVGVVLWWFMGPRNAAIVSVGIPFAFLVTMILMWLTGNSLNEITLFSFVLVSGIIVDDAIVVTENIYRHVQDGEPLSDAIVNGTAEVMLPVIAATATTVAAFLPMLMMTGSTGDFFALIPTAVTFAIIASLLECLFILPLHYRDFGPRPGQRVLAQERDDPAMRLLRRLTYVVVGWTLRHRWWSLGSVTIAFFAAVAVLVVSVAGIAPLVRIQFFPDDYKLYYVFIEGPPGTAIETMDRQVRSIADLVMADGPGYASSAAGFAGFILTEDYEQEPGHHRGTVMVALPGKDELAFDDPQTHLETMRERAIAHLADPRFRVWVRAERDGPPQGKDVNIQVVGSDEAAVHGLADALTVALQADPVIAADLVQFDDGRAPPARVLDLVVDATRAHEFGLTQGQAAALAAAVLDGRYLGKYRATGDEIDLKLGIDLAWLDSAERAFEVPVIEHASGPVRLAELARPVPGIEPSDLRRYQQQRSRTISANLRAGASSSAATVTAFARARYAELRDEHVGATLVFGGEYAATQRSFNSLFQAFGLAVLVIYMILAAQFRSYSQPLIVLSAVVFSIIGVVLGKLVTQSLFTVNSFIAVVGVTGVVVNDSLVLIEFINRGYRAGLDRTAAIRQGLDHRLRPIVLTTLTTTLGLLPMALGIPSYSVIWGSMASTFVTGLASATLLTLFLVPVGWDLLTERAERRGRGRQQRAFPAPAPDGTAGAPVRSGPGIDSEPKR